MRWTRALRARTGCGRTVLALAAALAALHGDPGPGPWPQSACAVALGVDELLNAMTFSVAEQQRITDGEIVSTAMPSSTNRELAVGLAFTTAMPPQTAVVTFREAIYQRDPKVMAWGKLNGDGTLDDLTTLRLASPRSR